MRIWSVASILLALTGCHAPSTGDDDLVRSGQVWAESSSIRRATLLDSFVDSTNGYSQLRIEKYTESEWGSLPLWNPPTQPVSPQQVSPTQVDGMPLDYESVPWEREALEALGRQAFFSYPVQLAPALLVAIDKPEEHGLPVIDGQFASIVWAQSPGGVMPAFTCASCHADHTADGPVPGRTNHHFDYGAMLDAYFGTPSISGTWGPGRVDVTGDGMDNPTYITDLRPVAFQNRIHRAGTLYNSPTALAARLETLLITSLSQAARPPRKIIFAMAVYLLSLAEELPLVPLGTPGRAVFDEHCASCHGGEGLSGESIPLAEIGTPSAVGLSPARGTGAYRIPSLRGLGDRGALFSDGSVPDLDALLDPTRETPGHDYGTRLPADEKAHLIAFLSDL